MDAGEVFLSCNNLTLGQYRTIVLSRALTGAGGCVVSIAVLVAILLRRAWENLTKRVYVANVIYSLLYCSVAIAAVNYSHPPSQESAWCEAMGFLLHYSGTLVIVHFCAFPLIVVFQVTLPVFQAVRHKKKNCTPKRTKLGEVFLFLTMFFCPLLNSWEPFLPQIPSYGNYGPLCWFRLELTNNCTSNIFNERFLEAIPNSVLCFGCFVLTFTVLLALCGMYWKFRTKKSGSRIIRIIPTVAILTVLILVVMLWFLLSAVRSKGFHKIGSFSAWLKNITVTTATTIGTLLAVGIYVHFPTHLCKQCRRAVVVRRAPHQQLPSARQSEGIEQQPAHPPEHNNPPESRFNNLHSPVTTDHKPAPLILYPPDVTHRYDSKPSHTRYSNPHSPVTIDCESAPLILHLPKPDHLYDPSNAKYNIPHSTINADRNTVSLSPYLPYQEHHYNPSHTRFSNVHSPVTTETTPLMGHRNDPSRTWYSVSHEPFTTNT